MRLYLLGQKEAEVESVVNRLIAEIGEPSVVLLHVVAHAQGESKVWCLLFLLQLYLDGIFERSHVKDMLR